MRKIGIYAVLAVLLTLPVLLRHSSDNGLLEDTDTKVLISAIRERHAPLSWFAGDWPLKNHFYRPVSTLTFELDDRIHPDSSPGFGWTNVILASLCILALFWFLAEFSGSGCFALFGSGVFTLWTLDLGHTFWIQTACQTGALASLAFGALRHGKQVMRYLPAVALFIYLGIELNGQNDLMTRMIYWLPGRTASVMTLFCLTSLAAYCRYATASQSDSAPATPLDRPATRTSTQSAPRSWVWGAISILTAMLALCSYEQAVMLPICLALVAFALSKQRRPVRKWVVGGVFGALATYLAIRFAVVPTGVSRYQSQQFRAGPAVWIDIGCYIFPAARDIIPLMASLGEGALIWLNLAPYQNLLAIASNAISATQLKLRAVPALTGLATSTLAFAPLAFSKPFAHYHYWPMAMRAMLVAALGGIALELFVTAASRPTIQAPARPDPAPGSLPRP